MKDEHIIGAIVGAVLGWYLAKHYKACGCNKQQAAAVDVDPMGWLGQWQG